MKKFTMIILTGVFSILLLTGCSINNEPFTQKNYTADGAQIKEVNVDVRDRQIEVSRSSDDQIHIDYFVNTKETYEISVSGGNVLTMESKSDKGWMDYFGAKAGAENRKISLRLPDALLSALKLSTTNEDISLSGLTVTDVISLSTNGGDIVFEKLNAGNTLSLQSKNGNIDGTIIGSYDEYSIDCEIKKGESNLPQSKQSGAKKLSVSVNNGDATVAFEKS